jgi:hypothetical protein
MQHLSTGHDEAKPPVTFREIRILAQTLTPTCLLQHPLKRGIMEQPPHFSAGLDDGGDPILSRELTL